MQNICHSERSVFVEKVTMPEIPENCDPERYRASHCRICCIKPALDAG